MENVSVKIEGVEDTMRRLKKLDSRLKKRIIRKVSRKALKPMVDAYRRNIKDADEVFKVYRKGRIYVEIIPGQLRKSIGIKSPKSMRSKDAVGFSVGPRKSGKTFKKPERGGWYAAFINFGWLKVGDGDDYQGKNRGFAQRAQASGKSRVAVIFRRDFKAQVDAEIKKLGFKNRIGLR